MKLRTTRSITTWQERALLAAAALLIALLASTPAHAQLDPLLFVKRVPPTVIVVMDTSFQMLNDGSAGSGDAWSYGSIYDTATYRVADASDQLKMALGLPSTATYYRRIYHNLRFATATPDATQKYAADSIEAVPDTDWRYNRFWAGTRYDMARLGIRDAVEHNRGGLFRWGLYKLRQNTPVRRSTCDKPVVVANIAAGIGDTGSACAGDGMLGIFATSVSALNSTALSTTATLVTPASGTGQSVLNVLGSDFSNGADTNPSLIPAGMDALGFEDRPLKLALTDAQTAATTAMTADTACPTCRNTVVVLVTAGRDYSADPTSKAAELKTLGGGAHKVPIFVIWVRPNSKSPQLAADQAQLQAIADSSGGVLITALNRSDVARGINLALQTGFSRPQDLNVQSARQSSEWYPVSPVVGTVDLENAVDATGAALINSRITTSTGAVIPQRNNIMLTAGFGIGLDDAYKIPYGPGFYGRLRAFRVFKPVADSTRPSGYKFTKDGTPLWPDRDGRPELAGLARLPRDPNTRNIFTRIPGVPGLVAFTTANAALLSPYMGSWSAANPSLNTSYMGAIGLISFIRQLPLGAIIGSTPAVMDPPSLDPPPDDAYGRSDAADTYAGLHKNRRSIIFVGANDGMLHALDARTGYEVWAFVPFNLLPKLRALYEQGQPVEQFNYYVDQSPKIAEVKVNGAWRSYLIIGEGPGGTFYQAFDVTEAGMGGPDPDSDDYAGVLASFAGGGRILFKWAFPDYANFDYNLRQDVWLTTTGTASGAASDATPGSVLRVYGDLKAAATPAEKTVGFTWSDPAVGALNADRSVNAAIVGSGYFPAGTEALAGRAGASVGHALYLINLATGKLIGNAGGAACGGTGCRDVGDDNNPAVKNALQADPTVTGDAGSYIAKWAYIGDLDGKYYRFEFGPTGVINAPLLMKTTSQPIYASSALMYVGTSDRYIFFMTGSDLLPTAPSSAGGVDTFRLIGIRDVNGVFSDSFTPIDLGAVTNMGGLPVGERPSTSPAVAGEIVFFTTTSDTAPSCSSTTVGAQTDSTYNLYAMTYKGSGAYAGQQTQVTNGNKNSGSNAPVLFQSGAGRATAPFVVDQHLYFATSGSSKPKVEAYGDPDDFNNGVGQVGVRILSWREIRR